MCQNVGKQGQVTEDLLCEIRVGKYSNTGCEHPFDFRTGFILRGIDSARCWRHSFRVFSQHWHDHHTFAIVLSIAYPWFKSFVPPHPKGALLDWDLVNVEAIWTHCHVQETISRWYEPQHSNLQCTQRMGALWSQKDGYGQQQSWDRLNARLVIKGPKCTKNISPPTLQQHRPELLIQGRVDPLFADVYTKFWPSQPNIAKEIDAYQTREHF